MENRNIFVTIENKKVNIKEGNLYQNENYYVITNQKLYDLEQKEINIGKIMELYESKTELSNTISNTFTILIIDKKQQKITCIQDLNGDTVPIYFYKHGDEIMFTNRIINIISYYKDLFCINEQAVNYFIKKGYIPNEQTLVKDIYKFIPNHNLIIDLNNKKFKFVKKKIKYPKIKNYSTDMYINDFKNILCNIAKNKRVFLTLSNGYDSNFIFSFLDKKKPIEAFSIGGIVGTDETKDVKENIKNYNNTHLNVSYVSEDTLDEYPEIIYNLEGAVYERGIFLQYELYKCVKENKKENVVMFFGEGADQVFSYEYYNKTFYILKSIKYVLGLLKKGSSSDEFENLHIKGGFIKKTNAYQFLTYVITKKNGIFMNKLNIKTCYPYLSKNIINIGYKNRYINIKTKNLQKKACKKQIDKKIMKNLAKVGGATDSIALFKNCKYIQEIEDFVHNSKYNILKINKNIDSNDYLNYLLKVVYLEIFEYLFIEHHYNINNEKNLKLMQIIKKIRER